MWLHGDGFAKNAGKESKWIETRIGHRRDTDVFNGIAHDPVTGKVYVTGKNWDKLFEIDVKL